MTLDSRLDGATVVASISGGKDSAALSLWLTEQGIEHRRVHMLTGWDSDVTMSYLRGPLSLKIGPIEEIRGDLLMPDLLRKKGMFPSRVRRFCTEDLKIKPFIRYVENLQTAGAEVVSAVGIRAAESEARSRFDEWEWQTAYDSWVWRPLLRWTLQDVIDIHRRHDLEPNPLYLLGAERVGCWPCIFARKSEIRFIADTDPDRIDEIRALESEVKKIQHDRIRAKGEEPRFDAPGWFQGPNAESRSAPWPIDKAVAWSRTSRGGKQMEMFATETDGCMRWGLCETVAGDDQGHDDE